MSDDRQSVEQIRERLRKLILDGTLRPGAAISQVKLSRDLDVGRTPLREAMRMLQHEGLLEGEYNRRVRVANVSLGDLEQVYAMRIVQEAMAIRLSVPRFDDDDFAAMRERLTEMNELAGTETYAEWEFAHQLLHRLFVSHSGQRILATLSLLADHALRFRRSQLAVLPISYDRARLEHEAIVEACVARNARLAGDLLARHFARTAITLVTTVRPEHDPYTVREALRVVTTHDDVDVPSARPTQGS